jgi:hypothetical protein
VTEHIFHEFGAIEFDDSDDVTDELYTPLDPARDILLDLFTAAINWELAKGLTTATMSAASRWGRAIAGTKLAGTLPVADKFWLQLTPDILRETAFEFPLLTLYRQRANEEDHALGRGKLTQRWGMDYVLPPLGTDDLRRVSAVFVGVAKLVQLVLRFRGHPAYASGANKLGDGDGDGFAHLSSIRIVETVEGPVSFQPQGDGPIYYALHFEIETTELEQPMDGVFTDFEAADIAVDVGDRDGVIPNLIEASTDVNPDPNHGDPIG